MAYMPAEHRSAYSDYGRIRYAITLAGALREDLGRELNLEALGRRH